MPVVCINRPNRKTPRKWTARDVARVAKYAEADGNPALLIAGLVMSALGLGAGLCLAEPKLRIAIQTAIRIKSYVDIAGILNWIAIITRFLAILKRFSRVPFLTVLALGLSIALAGTIRLLRDVIDILEGLDGLEDSLEVIEGLCSAAKIGG